MDEFQIPDNLGELEQLSSGIRLVGKISSEQQHEVEELLSKTIITLHNALSTVREVVEGQMAPDDRIGNKHEPIIFMKFQIGHLDIELGAKIDLLQDKWEAVIEATSGKDDV